MADLFEAQTITKPRHIYTVSELTRDIKLILENTFTEVWVEGEISGIRRISSGTAFFTLKDNTGILKCVMFSSFAKTIKFEIKDGLKVICFGHIGVYEKEGQYQLYTERIEPKGIGSLQLALEQLKQRLEKEGLFSAEHKRPLPYLPSKIGVVTSLSGAAIKDILRILDRRFSDIHIIINPVRVQGEEAKQEIAQAIKDFNRLNERLPLHQRIEVMIVGRGGGSIEDLWAFNEEIVAKAVYNSKIPIISAVGHERDWTITDLVADVRAATPSAAAELVIPKKEDLRERIDALSEDLKISFSDITAGYQETIDDLVHRLSLGMQNYIKLRQAEFKVAIEKLSSLSPLNILGRGYSITFKMPEGKIIKDAKFIKLKDIIKTKLYKGEMVSQVTKIVNS